MANEQRQRSQTAARAGARVAVFALIGALFAAGPQCARADGDAPAKLRIMTAPYPPLMDCTEKDTGISEDKFKGIDANNIRGVMELAKFDENDWEFLCIRFEDWQAKLRNTKDFTAFAGALQIDYKPIEDPTQVLFSQSYWNTGVTVVTYAGIDQWQFIRMITFRVALLVAGSAIIAGVLHFFFERRKQSLENYVWNAFTNVFFLPTVPLTKVASRMVQFGVWFMVLIVVANFTGQITAVKTLSQFENDITSVYSLLGKRVKTLSAYQDLMVQIGARPVPTQFGQPGEYDALGPDSITAQMVVTDLTRKDEYRIDAFVIDDTFASILEHVNCYIFMKKRLFRTFAYGFAFDVSANTTLIRRINIAIEEYVRQNSAENNLEKYVNDNYPQCVKDPTQGDVNSQHLTALFLVQGIASACALVLFIFTKVPIYGKTRALMEKYKVFNKKGEQPKRVGDAVCTENLKELTQRLYQQFNLDVGSRLDQMEETVTLYFEKLLSEEQLRRQKRIAKHVGDIDSFIERHEKSNSRIKEDVSREQIPEANSIDQGAGKGAQIVEAEEEEEQPSEDLLGGDYNRPDNGANGVVAEQANEDDDEDAQDRESDVRGGGGAGLAPNTQQDAEQMSLVDLNESSVIEGVGEGAQDDEYAAPQAQPFAQSKSYSAVRNSQQYQQQLQNDASDRAGALLRSQISSVQSDRKFARRDNASNGNHNSNLNNNTNNNNNNNNNFMDDDDDDDIEIFGQSNNVRAQNLQNQNQSNQRSSQKGEERKSQRRESWEEDLAPPPPQQQQPDTRKRQDIPADDDLDIFSPDEDSKPPSNQQQQQLQLQQSRKFQRQPDRDAFDAQGVSERSQGPGGYSREQNYSGVRNSQQQQNQQKSQKSQPQQDEDEQESDFMMAESFGAGAKGDKNGDD